MNLYRPLRSSVKVWLAISIPLFLSAWFLPFGKHGDEPVGVIWWVFITHQYSCSIGQMLMGLGIYTFVLAMPAVLAGWVLQFPICAALDHFHRGKTKDENHTAE